MVRGGKGSHLPSTTCVNILLFSCTHVDRYVLNVCIMCTLLEYPTTCSLLYVFSVNYVCIIYTNRKSDCLCSNYIDRCSLMCALYVHCLYYSQCPVNYVLIVFTCVQRIQDIRPRAWTDDRNIFAHEESEEYVKGFLPTSVLPDFDDGKWTRDSRALCQGATLEKLAEVGSSFLCLLYLCCPPFCSFLRFSSTFVSYTTLPLSSA